MLKYTETLPAIAGTSLASEVVRGLGYWYFYGSDRIGPWKQAAVRLEESAWLLATSFAVPALGVLGAFVSRWRVRAFFVLLIFLGLVLAVGMHPYRGPSVLGRVLKAFMSGSSVGLALRSSDRATPLVVLGLAVLLGAGATALWTRLPRVGLGTACALAAVVVANSAPFLEGGAVAQNFARPETVPSVLRPRRLLPGRPGRLHTSAHRAGAELRRLRLGHSLRHHLARDHDKARSAT